MENLNKVKDIVEHILKTDERARNDDKWLILMVWQRMQNIKVYVPYNELGNMITPESITRVRRKIQNKDKRYLPTREEVRIKRKINEEEFRNWAVTQ